jgi:sugar lactone lactonase YvrE
MLSALQWAGYSVTNAWGDGGHNGKHGGAVFPDAMRWLWSDYPKPIEARLSPRAPISDILIQGEEWQVAAEGYKFTEGPAVNDKGEIFFTDISSNRIYKIALDAKVSVFAEDTGGANGLIFDREGNLWACAGAKKQVVRYSPQGKPAIAAHDVESNDIVVAANGHFYFTDPNHRRVWHGQPNGRVTVADNGITRPNGVILTPDQSLLLVSDTAGQMVYSFQILPDGGLTNKQPYFHLHLTDTAGQSGGDGMTVDMQGRLYVTTLAGIQVCDQAGRVNCIISRPQSAWLSNVTFGGPDLDMLYATCGDKVYKRKTKAKGVVFFRPPILSPPPRL